MIERNPNKDFRPIEELRPMKTPREIIEEIRRQAKFALNYIKIEDGDLLALADAFEALEKDKWITFQFCDYHKTHDEWTQCGCPVCSAGKENKDAVEARNALAAIIAPAEVGGGIVAHLTAERDRLRLLAERAYPNLKASGACSAHHTPDGHFECRTCYPDLPALILAHVEAHQKTIAERDQLKTELGAEKAAHTATAQELWDMSKERDALRAESAEAAKDQLARIAKLRLEKHAAEHERDALRAEVSEGTAALEAHMLRSAQLQDELAALRADRDAWNKLANDRLKQLQDAGIVPKD